MNNDNSDDKSANETALLTIDKNILDEMFKNYSNDIITGVAAEIAELHKEFLKISVNVRAAEKNRASDSSLPRQIHNKDNN
jgi:signal transduction histidine kinase